MPVQAVYFAWVDQGVAFNAVTHAVEDEKIVRFSVEQQEGEFAIARIDIKNPRIGLLNAGRKLWAYLSYHNGTSVVPIFYGRVIGIPTNLHLEVITLEFVARPVDYVEQKEGLAATMRFLPYYDPVFIKEELWLDPDVVLEARTELWHIDRVTHTVSTSDLLVGEDGVEEFEASLVVRGSLGVAFEQPPVRRVRVVADVTWDQVVSSEEFGALPFLKNYEIETIAGAGVISGWPEAGTNLGGGWSVASSFARSPHQNLDERDWAGWYLRGDVPPPGPPFYLSFISGYSASVSSNNVESKGTRFNIIQDKVYVDLSLSYSATRKRKDILTFDLVADTQPIVTDPGDEEFMLINVSGNDVSKPDILVEYGNSVIASQTYRSYFPTERGEMSIQYLIQLARANLVLRSRAIRIEFEVYMDFAESISLRKNAIVHDQRLPGGQASGKIVSYSINSDAGRYWCKIVLASCIGRGGAIEATDGEPVYAEAGYMQPGYQQMENQIRVIGTSDVGFRRLYENANDDGLVFPLSEVPLLSGPAIVTTEEAPLQANLTPSTVQQNVDQDDCGNTSSVSINSNIDTSPWTEWLGGVSTTVDFELKSVEGGPFETTYQLEVTQLVLPQQIDLEAESLA